MGGVAHLKEPLTTRTGLQTITYDVQGFNDKLIGKLKAVLNGSLRCARTFREPGFVCKLRDSSFSGTQIGNLQRAGEISEEPDQVVSLAFFFPAWPAALKVALEKTREPETSSRK
jgi:hypothetical protein